MTTRAITLDVRGMEPPEPLQKVLETIEGFGDEDQLTVVIDCRPQPLFRILERTGFAYREETGTASRYEITIWRRHPPA